MDKKKDKSTRNSNVDEGIPEAKYTRFGERIRQAIPGPMQCSVGCGGKNCKWENPARWSDADQAIKGVFSSWVLDDVVAMSRPSTEIIKKYKMIDQFKRHNIYSIINLQRPGEHASCGPPLDKESLFTYRPQEFMDNDIFFYNFGWKDYGVTSMSTVLDMVKVMSFALEQGKVAVHCHAGLGRTGVLIACYLVYAERLDPASAILKVRKKRSSSIQTRGQIACISEFWQFLRPLRIVFPQVVPHAKRLTLKQFLTRQRHLLHGFESRELRHTPKLIHEVCKRLCEIAKVDSSKEEDTVSVSSLKRCNTLAEIKETLPGAFVNEPSRSEHTDSVLEILASAPSAAEAVLSPRVARKSSARSVSSLEANNRPRSACDETRPSADDVFDTSSGDKSPGDDVVDAEVELNIAVVDGESAGSDELVAGNNSFERLKDIPDEQIEREVNEILGCNANNNNHSITEVATLPTIVDDDEPTKDISQSPRPDIEPSAPVETQSSTDSAPSSAENRFSTDQPSAATLRKPRNSAGKSDTILPTGLPLKNPRTSASGNRPPLANRAELSSTDNEDNAASEPIDSSALPLDTNQSARLSPTPIVSDIQPAVASSTPVPDEAAGTATKPNSDQSAAPTGHGLPSAKHRPMFVVPYLDPVLPTPLPTNDDGVEINGTDGVHEVAPATNDDVPTVDPTHLHLPVPSLIPPNASPIAPAPNADDSIPLAPPSVFSLSDVICHPALSDDVIRSVAPSIVRDDEGASVVVEKKRAEVVTSAKTDVVLLQDVSDDDDLDEIIDIDDDGLDDRSLDGDDEGGQSDAGNLSHSIASRVSWSHMQRKADVDATGTSQEERQISATSGRRTPLMYRGEKNLTLMSDVTVEDGATSSKPDRSKGDSSDDEPVRESIADTKSSSDNDDVNPTDPEVIRPSSSLNLPTLARISATRSLNDLSSPTHTEPPVTFSRCSSSGDMRHPSPHGHQTSSEHVNPTHAALGLSYKLIDDEWLWEKVYLLQIEINNHKDGWKAIPETTDAYLLSSLMWSWVEHLSEPLLGEKAALQLLSIIERDMTSSESDHVTEGFEKALSSLEPGICNTLKCLLSCVLSFPALPRRVTESMVARIVAAITQTAMPPAEQSPTNIKVARVLQRYINAEYDVSNRLRFIDDLKEDDDVIVPSTRGFRMTSSDSDSSRDEAENGSVPFDCNDVAEVARRSAGSAHSSGSSNAGSAVLSAPRIVVN